MKFSDLKKRELAFEYGERDRIENKQRISLSSHAYDILHRDIDVFQAKPPKNAGQNTIFSDFVNDVFEKFRADAESSVMCAVRRKKIVLSDLLSSMADQEARDQAISLMLDSYASELKERLTCRCREKDHSISFRIGKENLEYLLSDEGRQEAEVCRDDVGLYMKAVLEEYCELPYVKREAVYFREYVDMIEQAVRDKRMLKVRTRTQWVLYVKPFGLRMDPERMYHYLVGMTALAPEGPWQIGSIRLSNISVCRRLAYPAPITRESERKIAKAIKDTGVQFLLGYDTAQKIVVEFTPQGEQLYRSMLHLRPQCVKKAAPLIYEFHCSIRQASNYFFKFAEDARIVEPGELAAQFHDMYRNAAKKYEIK